MSAEVKPLVSVVTATWNAADYLREAIESALKQTYRPLEIVIVDDGSTDHTAEVCASFGDRVRYIFQPKDDKHGATAHVRAFQSARGEYLAGLDHDDRWLPEKIARQIEVMQARPDVGAVFTRFRLIDSAGQDKGPSPLVGPSGDVFHALLRRNRYCYSSGLYRRAVLDVVGHHDIEPGIGDWDLWLRIARRYPVAMLADILTEYRVHGQNYSMDRRMIALSTQRVVKRYRDQLHPGCVECRRSFRAGLRLAAEAYLEHFHAAARAGRLAAGLPSLWDALKISLVPALKPRHLLTLAKSFGVAVTARRSKPDQQAANQLSAIEQTRRS
ncbi:MAG: glycosyl transferase family 2 [Acidobacteria bacterium]|nr:MAG: glycosyl transferase family 2 [Acidobacteriota bacterium]